jgi:hypothetical protein
VARERRRPGKVRWPVTGSGGARCIRVRKGGVEGATARQPPAGAGAAGVAEEPENP